MDIPSKETFAAVFAALLLVSAGCTTNPNEGAAPVAGGGVAPAGNTTPDYFDYKMLENLTTSKFESIESTARNIHYKLRNLNHSERLNVTQAVAQRSCSLPAFNSSIADQASTVREESFRAKHLYEVASAYSRHFNADINPEEIRSRVDKVGVVGQFAPVVGSYNNYREKACAFDADDPDTVQDFYIASAGLGMEFALIQQQVYYKTSFKAVQKASHTAPFKMVQSQFGDDALSLMMSEAHWFARGHLSGAKTFTVQKFQQMNLSAPSVDMESIQSTLDKKISRTKVFLDRGFEEVVSTASDSEITQCLQEHVSEGNESSQPEEDDSDGLLGKVGDVGDSIVGVGESGLEIAEKLISGDLSVAELRESLDDTTQTEVEGCLSDSSE